jgi:hypothetical protein
MTHDAPDPYIAGMQDSELHDTWCTRALPCREAGSGALVHVAASDPFLSGRRDWDPLDMWQPRAHLGWETESDTAGVPDLQGTDTFYVGQPVINNYLC